MIKTILKFGAILVVGILAYNYFFGSPEEKKQARDITGAIADVGKKSFGLLKEEYQKFKEGKYDRALDKIGNALSDLKDKGGAMVEDIKDWEDRKGKWEEKRKELEAFIDNNPDSESDEIKEQLDELSEEGKALEKEGEKLKEKAEKQE